MDFDIFNELEKGETEEKIKAIKHRFTFEWLGEQILKRQKYKKDMIIIIIGDRGSGKSNYALKIVRAYIKLRKKQDPNFKWSWKENFPLTRSSAEKMMEKLPKRSFIDYDEGGDQFYSQEGVNRVQRELVKIITKGRFKLHLTIITWPDPFTLDPRIINMASLLVLIGYRYRDVCGFAFLFGRSTNPFTYDKFGILKIRKLLESTSRTWNPLGIPSMDGLMKVRHKNKIIEIPYPKRMFKFFRSLPSFLAFHRFGAVDKRMEEAYIKNVKNRQMEAKEEDRFVPVMVHNQLKKQYATLLYNLTTKGGMTYAQIERLHISPTDGAHLKSLPGIKAAIDSIKGML